MAIKILKVDNASKFVDVRLNMDVTKVLIALLEAKIDADMVAAFGDGDRPVYAPDGMLVAMGLSSALAMATEPGYNEELEFDFQDDEPTEMRLSLANMWD